MEQLPLDLARRPALGREAFLVAPSNQTAVAMIDDWLSWPSGKLVLIGEQGAGKTHLAQVWAGQAGAAVHTAADLADIPIPTSSVNLVIEDADQAASGGAGAYWEQAFFHLHNAVLEHEGRLLITGRHPPSRWPVALPDLRSRLQATSVVRLDTPDDALLAGVLVKLFDDRGLRIDASVVAYLIARIDRSVAAAAQVVAHLDAAALREGRELRLPFVRKTLKASPPESAP